MSVVEKEAKLKKMMEDELESKSGHHTPEGLFTKPTQDIVDGLLKDAHGDEELALRRITFYINRAGDGLSNKTAVNAAKRELEKKVEAKKEAGKNDLYNILSEYFNEAYVNMFEDDDDKSNKKMSQRDALWYLLNNDINVAWMLGSPHPELVDPQRNKSLGLFDVMQDGKLKMLTHKNDPEHGYKARWVDDGIRLTPEEFKDLIEDDANNDSVASWVSEVEDHYRPVEEEKDILMSGEKLFDAWINRFYDENKDELHLKSPKDKRTYDAFVNWWNAQTDYTRRNYAPGVSDIWDLATLDVRKSMPIIRIRQRAMARNVNSKTKQDDALKVPSLANEKEKEAWEKYDMLTSLLQNHSIDKQKHAGLYNAIEKVLCDKDGQGIEPSKDRTEYWKDRFIGDEPEKFALRMYPNISSTEMDAMRTSAKINIIKEIMNSTPQGKEELKQIEDEMERLTSKARGEVDDSKKNMWFLKNLPDKYKTDPGINSRAEEEYKKELENVQNSIKANRQQAEAEKREEIIEDNPEIDKYSALMSICEKMYLSQAKKFNGLDQDDSITQEEIDNFDKYMSLPGPFDDSDTVFEKELTRRKFGAKHDEVDLVDPEVLEKRVQEFEARFPGYIEKLNKWEQDVNDPNILVRTIIVPNASVDSKDFRVDREVAKKVGTYPDGSDQWEVVTNPEEKEKLLAKKLAPKPKLDMPRVTGSRFKPKTAAEIETDKQRAELEKQKADEERKARIKNCLAQYNNQYHDFSYFADKPISDGKDLWKIVDVIESPYGGQPRFQIASLSNPAFSSMVKKTYATATGPNRSGILDWIANYNEPDKNQNTSNDSEPEDDEDEVSMSDVAKYADQLKKHFEGEDK